MSLMQSLILCLQVDLRCAPAAFDSLDCEQSIGDDFQYNTKTPGPYSEN